MTLSILWIEDEICTIQSFVEHMKIEGLSVTVATGVYDALCVSNERVFDVVISDWMLGDGYGTDAIWKIGLKQLDAILVLFSILPEIPRQMIHHPMERTIYVGTKMVSYVGTKMVSYVGTKMVSAHNLTAELLVLVNARKIGSNLPRSSLNILSPIVATTSLPLSEQQFLFNSLDGIWMDIFSACESSGSIGSELRADLDSFATLSADLCKVLNQIGPIHNNTVQKALHDLWNKYHRLNAFIMMLEEQKVSTNIDYIRLNQLLLTINNRLQLCRSPQ